MIDAGVAASGADLDLLEDLPGTSELAPRSGHTIVTCGPPQMKHPPLKGWL